MKLHWVVTLVLALLCAAPLALGQGAATDVKDATKTAGKKVGPR